MKKTLRNLAIGTALVGGLAGCKAEQPNEPNEELFLSGTVSHIHVHLEQNKVGLEIKVPRDRNLSGYYKFRGDTTDILLSINPALLQTAYPISVGDDIHFKLTGGFDKVTEFETILGTQREYYVMDSWSSEGRITYYGRGGRPFD